MRGILSKDFSVRIPATSERILLLDKRNSEKRALSRIRDIMLKPVETGLSDYHPSEICLRLREFLGGEQPSTLMEIKTIKTEIGYTDEKRKLGEGKTSELRAKAKKLGYEQWGEMATISTEYRLDFDDGSNTSVLFQEIRPLGKYLKIESLTQKGLEKTLALFSTAEKEKIEKNAAALLAEKLGF